MSAIVSSVTSESNSSWKRWQRPACGLCFIPEGKGREIFREEDSSLRLLLECDGHLYERVIFIGTKWQGLRGNSEGGAHDRKRVHFNVIKTHTSTLNQSWNVFL